MNHETVAELDTYARRLGLAHRPVVSVRLAGVPAGWWELWQPFRTRILGNVAVCTCTRTVNGRMVEASGEDQDGTRYVLAFPDALPMLVVKGRP